MTSISATVIERNVPVHLQTLVPGVAVALTVLMVLARDWLPWASAYPGDWVFRFDQVLTSAIDWLIDDADLGLFTVKELTRAFGAVLDAPMLVIKGLLATGFHFGDAETGLTLPPLSWVSMVHRPPSICGRILAAERYSPSRGPGRILVTGDSQRRKHGRTRNQL